MALTSNAIWFTILILVSLRNGWLFASWAINLTTFHTYMRYIFGVLGAISYSIAGFVMVHLINELICGVTHN